MIRMFGFGTSSNRYDNGFRVSLLSCGNGTLAACCPCPRRGSACVAMGDLDEDGGMGPGLSDEVTALFMTKRHGTDLPSKLIKVIVSYYLDVLEIDSMEDIEHDDPNEMEEAAKDAYASAMGKELPLPYIYRVRKWAGEVQHSAKGASVKESLASTKEVGAYVEEDRRDAARKEAAIMGLSPFDREKAIKDMASQGLSCKRMIYLSLSLHRGKVCKPIEDSDLKYGEDPAHAQVMKDARKAKQRVLSTVLTNKSFSEAGGYFSGLMMGYSQSGMIEESSLIASWWAETSGCFSSENDLLFEYLTEYFNKYVGRGLPEMIDTVLVTRLRNSSISSGPSKEEFKKLKEAGAEMAKDIAKLKSEVNTLNQKVGTLRPKPTEEEAAARRAKITCNVCGEKGHYGYECTKNGSNKGNKKKDDDEK